MLAFLTTLFAFVSVATAATTDMQCVAACSDWSVTLGYCRSVYGNLPMQQNYTFVQDFLTCLCMGTEGDKVLGNDTLLTSAGICQSCESTPKPIRENLSDLLELCAVQGTNGTAAGAMVFTPLGYTTSEAAIGRPAGQDMDTYSTGSGIPTVPIGIDALGWAIALSASIVSLMSMIV